MSCNDEAGQLSTKESACYPTGCPPCNEAIDFPDDPKDGQRFCVPIGSEGEDKCWVYDKCVPAWRAEGPSASPSRYRGAINPCTTAPADDVVAGDWYIISVDRDGCTPQAGWGLSLGDFSKGDRIAFNGVAWQTIEPASIPFASEALDGDVPDPDTRGAGIVKNATVGQAIAGTNKCDSITPYTLKKVLEEGGDDLVDFKPTKPETVFVSIVEGTAVSQCVTENDLILTANAVATSANGNPALGNFAYQWVESTTGADVVLGGQNSMVLKIENYPGFTDPSTTIRKFKCKATFVDLFSETKEAVSAETSVTLKQALSLVSNPSSLDLSGATASGTMLVNVTSVDNDLPAITPTYQWYLDGVPITGAQQPANTGYQFGGFTTNQLQILRLAADAGGDYTVYCVINGGECNDNGIVTNNANLNGPAGAGGGGDSGGGGGGGGTMPTLPSTPGAVGTYIAQVRSFSNQLPTGVTGTWRIMSTTILPGGTGSPTSQFLILYLRIA